MRDIGELYLQIEECTAEVTKQELISDLSIDEFVGYLRYKYNNESISYGESANGEYVITDGDRAIISFSKEEDFGVVYQERIEGNDNIVRDLSNESTYDEVDVKYLNPSSSGTQANYVVNIDVELYEEIIERYKTIYEDLEQWKKFSDSSMITGYLRNYYDNINGDNDIEKIMSEVTYDFSEVLLKIQAILDTYEDIDESLRFMMDSMITEVFSLDTSTISVEGNTYEERRKYVEAMIVSYKNVLSEFETKFEDLYGNGIPMNKETAVCFVNLLDSLGLFVVSGMNEMGGIENVSYGESNITSLYDEETGCFDIIQLGFVLTYCEQNNVIPTLKSYIIDGENWHDSGMDALFGENLVKNYGPYINSRPESYEYVEPPVDYDSDYYEVNPIYCGWCALDDNGNIMFDAESVFITNYINSYLVDDESSRYEFYSDIVNISDGLSDVYTPLDLSDGNRHYMNYYLDSRYTDAENGRYIIDYAFGLYNLARGTLFFDRLPLTNKNFASYIVKQHIKNNNVFDMFEVDEDESTKNLIEMYDEACTLAQDIKCLSTSIYQYERYLELMPYEECRSNVNFSPYLYKDYSGYALSNPKFLYGKYEDWLKYMDKSEVALYAYLVDTKGEEYANGYLDALSDIVNQRIGYSRGVSYVSLLNKDGAPGVIDDILDFVVSSGTGFVDGNRNFWYGVGNYFGGADGIFSADDYEFQFKLMLLQGDNEYNENLTPWDRTALSYIYQWGNSLGYMATPILLSYVPVVGEPLSLGSLFISSSGNNTESLMQQGVSKSTAYLYGSLMGLSEVAIEKLFGGLPGSPDVAGKGVTKFLSSLGDEAREEFVQTYMSAGLVSLATGEPIDLSQTTNEAFQAATMAIFTATAMNAGGYVTIKLADGVVAKVGGRKADGTPYKSYEDWRGAIESELRESHPHLANLFLVPAQTSNVEVLDITREELPLVSDANKGMITGITYNPETELYEVQLINGVSFETGNLSEVDNAMIVSNLYIRGFDTSGLPNGLTPDAQSDTIDESSSSETSSFATLLTNAGDVIKTLGGKVTGLTTDVIATCNDKLDLFRQKLLEIKNARYLTMPLEQINFSKMSEADIIYILNNNTSGITLQNIPNFLFEIAKTNVEIAEIFMKNGIYGFINDASKEVLLKFLPSVYDSGRYHYYPALALTDADIAKICVTNLAKVGGLVNFICKVDKNILQEILPVAYEKGHYQIMLSVAMNNSEMAEICVENGIFDFINMIYDRDILKNVLSVAYKNGYNESPDLALRDIQIAKICVENGIFDFIDNPQIDINLLIKVLPLAYANGYNGVPDRAMEDIGLARICIRYVKWHHKFADQIKTASILKYIPDFCTAAILQNDYDSIQYFNPIAFNDDVLQLLISNPQITSKFTNERMISFIDFIRTTDSERVTMLRNWLKKNPYLYDKIDYRILSEDILKTLGEDRVFEMALYTGVNKYGVVGMSDRILNIYDNAFSSYRLLCTMLNTFQNADITNRTLYQPYVDRIVSFFENGHFSQNLPIISDYISNNSDSDTSRLLVQILLNVAIDPNMRYLSDGLTRIKSFEDIEKFIRQYSDDLEHIYSTGTDNDKREALLETILGMSLVRAETLLRQFQNFESVSNHVISGNIMTMYRNLKTMVYGNIDGISLPKGFKYIKMYELSMLLEQYLKNTYSSQIMETTFKADGEPDITIEFLVKDADGREVSATIPIFELPDNQTLVVHVKDAFGRSEPGFVMNGLRRTYKDSYYDFSSKYSTRHHLSTSLISNNQGDIAIADRGIVYGYSTWEVEALVEMGPNDIYSYSDYTIGLEAGHSSVFLDSSLLLDQTPNSCYNELAFERNGLIPSYVVIFDSFSDATKEKSYQAAYDWGIPVVLVKR